MSAQALKQGSTVYFSHVSNHDCRYGSFGRLFVFHVIVIVVVEAVVVFVAAFVLRHGFRVEAIRTFAHRREEVGVVLRRRRLHPRRRQGRTKDQGQSGKDDRPRHLAAEEVDAFSGRYLNASAV